MRHGLVCAIVMLAVTWGMAGEPAPDAARLRALIHQLGSESFAERARARAELEAIGAAALEPLRAALKHSDLETARRAAELIRVIEERELTARLLAPHKVRLVLDDVPVLEAVDQLAKLGGCVVRVDGDRLALAGKRVTLDTGTVTFWEAVDQLGARAGLVEKLTVASVPGDPRETTAEYFGPAMGGGLTRPTKRTGKRVPPPPPLRLVPLPPTPVAKPTAPPQGSAAPTPVIPGRVVLMPAAARPSQVSYAGAARVVLRPVMPSPGATPAKGDRTHDLVLTVSAEPSVLGFAVVGTPSIRRAVDEHGQALAFVIDALAPAGPGLPVEALEDRMLVENAQRGVPGSRPVTVRLQPGARPARSLRELSGSFTAQVLMPNTTLAALDAPLTAKGEAVTARGGGRLVLDTAELLGDEEYRVVVKLQGVPAAPGPGGAAQVFGKERANVPGSNGIPQLVLLDGKGRALPVSAGPSFSQESGPDGQAVAQMMEVRFRREAGREPPVRLELTGTYVAVVHVPFRFTEVPLP